MDPPPIPSGNCLASLRKGSIESRGFRLHGFERPWKKRQIVAIAIYGISAPVAIAVVAPSLPEGMARSVFVAVFAVTWLALGAVSVHSMWCNPGDPAVGCASLRGVAEEGKPFCSVCQVTVRPDSKHCWECNKCVANFDHHCPWLNNCIGEFNYASFFVSVWALLAMITVIVAGAIVPLVELRDGTSEMNATKVASMTVILVVYVPLWCLDLSLAGFHCFLCWKGITTYEHLTGKTKRPASDMTSGSAGASRQKGIGEGVPGIERPVSARSFASSGSVGREVTDFMYGSSEPAEPGADMVRPRPSSRRLHLGSPSSRASSVTVEGSPENKAWGALEDEDWSPAAEFDAERGPSRPKSVDRVSLSLQRAAAEAARLRQAGGDSPQKSCAVAAAMNSSLPPRTLADRANQLTKAQPPEDLTSL